MNSRNGLTLLLVTLVLLTGALLNHGGTRRALGTGWRVIFLPQAAKVEPVVKGTRDLLERPFLWLAGHGRV